jgi:hypothetical protein
MPEEVLISYHFLDVMRNGLQIRQMGGFVVHSGSLQTSRNALKAQSLHRWMFSKCRGICLKMAAFQKNKPAPGSSSGAGLCVHGHVKT